MVVGEAPGRFEDEQGRPFVGRAGQLLDELLREAGLARDEVFITNVVKARPPGNRDPTRAEVEHWMPVLEQQLALVAPRLVVPLGRHALAHFAPGAKIGEVHGRAITEQRPRAVPALPPGGGAALDEAARDAVRRRARAGRAGAFALSRVRLTGGHGAAGGPTGGRRASERRAPGAGARRSPAGRATTRSRAGSPSPPP